MRYFVFLFLNFSLYGQYFDTVSIGKKIEFVNYLKDNKQTTDALYFLDQINEKAPIDTLCLIEAKLLLELRREKDAADLLKKNEVLFPDSAFSKCSYRLLKNHTNLLTGKYNELTEPGCFNHVFHLDVWRLQLLTSAVLQKKPEDFELLFNSAKCADAVLSLVEFDLYVQNAEINRRRKKSAFLAGLLSAVIPGLGKLYAGKPHEALGSFLPVAFNAIQAGEGFYHKGFDSPHFYAFGALGSIFYTSNIVGSARAAKRKNLEFFDKIKGNVEFEISKLIKYY